MKTAHATISEAYLTSLLEISLARRPLCHTLSKSPWISQATMHTSSLLSVRSLLNYGMQSTKDTGMRLPQRWASSYNRFKCLYIIPEQNTFNFNVQLLCKDSSTNTRTTKAQIGHVFGNMQVMLSLGEGAFQCLILHCTRNYSSVLPDKVTEGILVWKLFCGRF